MKHYDVAAYIWPAYTGKERRAWQFWPQKTGEWETVREAQPKFPEQEWPRAPLWGYEDEADPLVMEKQIDAAVSHGVNVFIYDWYWYDDRPFLENCLNDGFLGAANNHLMQFYLMWANHDATTVWDRRISDDGETQIWSGSVDRRTFNKVAHRFIERYFVQKNYYKIAGCPVLSIYDINNLINGLGGLEATAEALDHFRAEVKKAGFPDLHLQMILWREGMINLSGVDGEKNYTVADVLERLHFDSITHYQFVHFTDMNREYRDILPDVKAEMERIAACHSLPYYPHASVGWDNNPRFRRPVYCNTRHNTPELFEEALRTACAFSDLHNPQVPLITVNSWNEWTETSYLQPDDRYGYGYLDAVQRVVMENEKKDPV